MVAVAQNWFDSAPFERPGHARAAPGRGAGAEGRDTYSARQTPTSSQGRDHAHTTAHASLHPERLRWCVGIAQAEGGAR